MFNRCMCMFHRNWLLTINQLWETFTDKKHTNQVSPTCSRSLTAPRSVATWTGHSDAPARHLLQRNPSHPKLPYSRRPVPLFLHISGLNYWTEVEELKLILWAEFQYELKFIYLPVKKRCVVCVLCLLYCFKCLFRCESTVFCIVRAVDVMHLLCTDIIFVKQYTSMYSF